MTENYARKRHGKSMPLFYWSPARMLRVVSLAGRLKAGNSPKDGSPVTVCSAGGTPGPGGNAGCRQDCKMGSRVNSWASNSGCRRGSSWECTEECSSGCSSVYSSGCSSVYRERRPDARHPSRRNPGIPRRTYLGRPFISSFRVNKLINIIT